MWISFLVSTNWSMLQKVTSLFLTLVFNISLNHHFTHLACMHLFLSTYIFHFIYLPSALNNVLLNLKKSVSCFNSSCLELWNFIIDLGNNDLTKWSHNNDMLKESEKDGRMLVRLFCQRYNFLMHLTSKSGGVIILAVCHHPVWYNITVSAYSFPFMISLNDLLSVQL